MKYALSALAALVVLAVLALFALSLTANPPSQEAARVIEATTKNNVPGTTTATTTPECGLAWRPVDNPNPIGTDNRLNAISVLAVNDIWAVGSYATAVPSPAGVPLVQHWDGNSWNLIPSPTNLSWTNILRDVDALSPNDVWAVGEHISYGGRTSPFILHWDGIQLTRSDGLFTDGDTYLTGVSAIAPNDVWAVGYYATLICCYQVIGHWNGSEWVLVSAPITRGYLYDVAAISHNDVWAVGTSENQPLIVHWDGIGLQVIPSPILTHTVNKLNSVSALSANDVWAAGYSSSGGVRHSLIEHWDGAQWSVIPSPDVGKLTGISAASASSVWAVAESNAFLRWDGLAWSLVPGVNNQYTTLEDIVALSADDVWAVGSALGPTVIAHYNDPCSPNLVGHATWQGPPPQPSTNQQLPITLTLKSTTTEINYPIYNTDQSGYFTMSVGTLPDGTYDWRAKGPKYLANSGTMTLARASTPNLDIGTLIAGDANNDNLIDIHDFNTLKSTFGKTGGDPGYDERADFTNDDVVGAGDFNLLKNNFNLSGAPPIGPWEEPHTL